MENTDHMEDITVQEIFAVLPKPKSPVRDKQRGATGPQRNAAWIKYHGAYRQHSHLFKEWRDQHIDLIKELDCIHLQNHPDSLIRPPSPLTSQTTHYVTQPPADQLQGQDDLKDVHGPQELPGEIA